ncbi:hypothetical protein, partial [Agrobacterium rubi]|uniref:hypothetical protein n=1 Tax=Agrobacterium rubi TaxID=28099 RepID=UPI00201B4D71
MNITDDLATSNTTWKKLFSLSYMADTVQIKRISRRNEVDASIAQSLKFQKPQRYNHCLTTCAFFPSRLIACS